MTVRYQEREHACPICEECHEVRIVVGFPAAKCTACGWNRGDRYEECRRIEARQGEGQ